MDAGRAVTGMQEVIRVFSEARSKIEATFGRQSSEGIVSAVLRGEKPREGVVATGEEYFVHGIGYTVVLQNGGQVHLDSWEGGDILSIYDIQRFLVTSQADPVPDIDNITSACEDMCLEGLLVKAEGRKYLLPR